MMRQVQSERTSEPSSPGNNLGYSPVFSDELPFGGTSLADIQVLPKVDLHRHLVGAIRPEVLVRTAKRLRVNLTWGYDVDQVRSKLVLREPGDCDYATFLNKRIWGEFKRILRTELGCANAVYWAVADAAVDGVAYVEFRVSPYGIGPDQPMTLNQFLGGLRRGLRAAKRDFPSTVARFIFSIGRKAVEERWPRHHWTKYFKETVKAVVHNRDVIVGLDLSGDENKYPNRDFVEFAELARSSRVPLTVHAGETGNSNAIWEALELLKAQRIGHGIAACNDATLVQKLVVDQTPVEVCFTSNYLLGVVKPDEEHPFGRLYRAGVNVTVNTDDPVLFDETTLSREYYRLIRAGLLSAGELPALVLRSAAASFLPQAEKRLLCSRIEQFAGIA
jgi:adenosine deaminase